MEDMMIHEIAVPEDAFRKAVRFEGSFGDCNIETKAAPGILTRYESTYVPTLCDIHFGLQRMHDEEINNRVFLDAWFNPFCSIAHDWLQELLGKEVPGDLAQQLSLARMDFFTDERELLCGVFFSLSRRKFQQANAPVDFTKELTHIKLYQKNKCLPLEQWVLPDYLMSAYLHRFPSPQAIENASPTELSILRVFAKKKKKKGNTEACWRLAEAYDKGNALYDADKELALKYYRLTCENTDLPNCLTQYANALRGSGVSTMVAGLYTSAAASHYAEAMYNLSEMFASGEGVPKSNRAARQLLQDAVAEEKKKYLCKAWNNRLPEAALRLASKCAVGSHDAYRLVLLAKSALAQRRKIHGWKQDAELMQQILEAIANQEAFIFKARKETVNPVLTFADSFQEKIKHSALFTPREEGGSLRIQVSANVMNGVRLTRSIAYLPSLSFCGQIVSLTFRCRGHVSCDARENTAYVFDNIIQTRKNEYLFLLDGRKMMQLNCDSFLLYGDALERDNDSAEHYFVTAIHPDNGKLFNLLADGMDIEPGDEVLGSQKNDRFYMRVATTFSCSEDELPYPLAAYGSVVRVRKAIHK